MNISRLGELQVDRLISLGFHRQLALSPNDYRKRFPRIVPKPNGYDDRFDLMVIVEADPAVELSFQHRAAGIIECNKCGDLTTEGFQPETPYVIWTHDGRRYQTKSIGAAIETFARDEVPCSQLEVTSLFIHYPELFKGRGIDSGRTYNKNNYYSTLLWVDERAELALHHYNDFTPGLSVLSRGKLKEES